MCFLKYDDITSASSNKYTGGDKTVVKLCGYKSQEFLVFLFFIKEIKDVY